MSFIQIIEYETDRGAEVIELLDRSPAAQPDADSGFGRLVVTQDRGNFDRYLVIVEFPSYEQAMANSGRPETARLAEQMGALLTRGPTYHNLDVVQVTP